MKRSRRHFLLSMTLLGAVFSAECQQPMIGEVPLVKSTTFGVAQIPIPAGIKEPSEVILKRLNYEVDRAFKLFTLLVKSGLSRGAQAAKLGAKITAFTITNAGTIIKLALLIIGVIIAWKAISKSSKLALAIISSIQSTIKGIQEELAQVTAFKAGVSSAMGVFGSEIKSFFTFPSFEEQQEVEEVSFAPPTIRSAEQHEKAFREGLEGEYISVKYNDEDIDEDIKAFLAAKDQAARSWKEKSNEGWINEFKQFVSIIRQQEKRSPQQSQEKIQKAAQKAQQVEQKKPVEPTERQQREQFEKKSRERLGIWDEPELIPVAQEAVLMPSVAQRKELTGTELEKVLEETLFELESEGED